MMNGNGTQRELGTIREMALQMVTGMLIGTGTPG